MHSCPSSAQILLLALGGNAILQPGQDATYANQLANVETSAHFLTKLVQDGYRLAITHGNGPQVGNLLRQNEEAARVVPPFPLDVLSSASQGIIGFMLQDCLTRSLEQAGIKPKIACLVSRVAVNPDDPAFSDPTKPVGMFYDEAIAQKLMQEKNWQMKPDAGRGWRRVVPSPEPLEIVEKEAIVDLLQAGYITISCGGGGIPVARAKRGYTGIEAVIDKDLTGSCLAEAIQASLFLIVTDVEQVYIDYGKPEQKGIGNISVSEMETLQAKGYFSKGSMGPKVAAAIRFVRATGNPALICALHKVDEAVAGQSGTKILPDAK